MDVIVLDAMVSEISGMSEQFFEVASVEGFGVEVLEDDGTIHPSCSNSLVVQ